tara:strand:- start:404 stop:625 length:222 start_codon:yes stop_codon:yes gene_type:complete
MTTTTAKAATDIDDLIDIEKIRQNTANTKRQINAIISQIVELTQGTTPADFEHILMLTVLELKKASWKEVSDE